MFFIATLVIIAFTGSSVSFLSGLITPVWRWIVVVLALVYSLALGKFMPIVKSSLGIWVILFFSWALLTSAWSEIPALTFKKGIAFGLTGFGCMAAGFLVVVYHSPGKILNYLILLVGIFFWCGIFGFAQPDAVQKAGHSYLYDGLVDGSNMFGIMGSMCLPIVVWKLHLNWNNSLKRFCFIVIGLGVVFFVLFSGSRGAFVVVASTITGYWLTVNLEKKWRMASIGFLFTLITFVFVADVEEKISGFVFKFDTEQSVFMTREEVWERSEEQARLGGAFGGGFGVTIGADKTDTTFSAIGYGREKGSTIYALREEVGIVGLCIFMGLSFAMLALMVETNSILFGKEAGVLSGIVAGNLIGLLLLTFFEAWWVAPGSPESGCFWVLAGVLLALNYRARAKLEPRRRAGKRLKRRVRRPC